MFADPVTYYTSNSCSDVRITHAVAVSTYSTNNGNGNI